jgi:Fe-S-cluster containining protein
MFELASFVPEEFCLACTGCCRYPVARSAWSPLFLYKEIVALTEENVVPSCLFAEANARPGRAARICLVEQPSGFVCPCLEVPTNMCRIYGHRPLDCRLYPFLLARKGNQSYLAVDKKCPYARKMMGAKGMRHYVDYLLSVAAQDDFLSAVRENPEIVQAYPPEDLEFLATLSGLDPLVYDPSAADPSR